MPPKVPTPDSPGHSRRFAASVDVVDRLLLDGLIVDDKNACLPVGETNKDENKEDSLEMMTIPDSWGPWMTHDNSPTPPPIKDSLLETDESSSPERQASTSPQDKTQIASSSSHKTMSTPMAVLSQNQEQKQRPSSSSNNDLPYSSLLPMDSLTIADDSPTTSAETPLKLPPPPPYTCRRRLPLPPHLSENDLLSAVSTSSTPSPTLKTKRFVDRLL